MAVSMVLECEKRQTERGLSPIMTFIIPFIAGRVNYCHDDGKKKAPVSREEVIEE
jgi:hypothetical protein